MGRKIVIICADGLGPEYLAAAATPNLDRMAQAGVSGIGRSVIPSLTNVNNVSIITGTPPRCHGITANYCFDPVTGQEMFMESPQFLLQRTILQRAKDAHKSTRGSYTSEFGGVRVPWFGARAVRAVCTCCARCAHVLCARAVRFFL